MPIEFHCLQCGRLLRTQDDAAGKLARCPQCGNTQTVPPPGAVPAAPIPASPADPANPYASPAHQPSPSDFVPWGGAGELVPTPLDFGDAFTRTWGLLTGNYGTVLLLTIVYAVVAFSVQGFLGFVQGIVQENPQNNPVMVALVQLFIFGFNTIFSTWLGIGIAIAMLKVCRGEHASPGDLFSGGPKFLPVLAASVLMGLMVFGVIVAVVMPIILISMFALANLAPPARALAGAGLGYTVALGLIAYLALTYSQIGYLIIDRNAGILESFKLSSQIMQGNRLVFLLILIVMGVGGVIATLLTCLVGGLLLVLPFLLLLTPVIYLTVSGQFRQQSPLP